MTETYECDFCTNEAQRKDYRTFDGVTGSYRACLECCGSDNSTIMWLRDKKRENPEYVKALLKKIKNGEADEKEMEAVRLSIQKEYPEMDCQYRWQEIEIGESNEYKAKETSNE